MLIQRLLAFLAPSRNRLLLGMLCSALAAPLMPLVIQQASGFIKSSSNVNLSQAQRIAEILPVCFGVVGLYTLLVFLRYGQTYLLTEASLRLGLQVRREVFAHLQRMPLAYFHQQRTGALMATLTADVERMQSSAKLLRDAISLPIQALFCLGMLLYLSWKLTLFTLIAVPIMLLVIRQLTGRLQAITAEGQARLADVASIMEESLGAPRVVKAFTAEDREIARFDEANLAALGVNLRGVRRTALLSPLVDWIGSVAIAVVLYVGTVERIDARTFVAFLGMANMLATSVGGLGNLRGAFEELTGAAERLFHEILDVPATLADSHSATSLLPITGRIAFENVSFCYELDKPILQDITLTIEPGQVVAFVGQTGAGKSTLLDLVPRFYDPTQGRITIDGHDVRSVTIASLREQIGIVPQENVLFTGTIRSNLAYGKPEATDDEIEAAARAANAHDFILAQSEGYNTRVGSRGATLAGGQRQRLAIARALLSDPRVLILDEATSALDNKTESVVQEALGTWFKGRTTLIIAHRLSTIVHADKIVVLEQGRIAEHGTHLELLALGGLYSALFNAQQRGIVA